MKMLNRQITTEETNRYFSGVAAHRNKAMLNNTISIMVYLSYIWIFQNSVVAEIILTVFFVAIGLFMVFINIVLITNPKPKTVTNETWFKSSYEAIDWPLGNKQQYVNRVGLIFMISLCYYVGWGYAATIVIANFVIAQVAIYLVGRRTNELLDRLAITKGKSV